MAHFCMFGGNEGVLSADGSVYITVFGGSDLRRLPLARQIAERRLRGGAAAESFFFTLFGGTSLIWPTLAEEYLALRDAVRSGTLSLTEWDQCVGRGDGHGPIQTHSLTLFGGFEADTLPGEDKELDDLTLQRHLGHIPEPAVQTLMLAIGQRGAQRLAAVRHAAAMALLPAPAAS
jgi:hypothetical protein